MWSNASIDFERLLFLLAIIHFKLHMCISCRDLYLHLTQKNLAHNMATSFGISSVDNRPELMEEVTFLQIPSNLLNVIKLCLRSDFTAILEKEKRSTTWQNSSQSSTRSNVSRKPTSR